MVHWEGRGQRREEIEEEKGTSPARPEIYFALLSAVAGTQVEEMSKRAAEADSRARNLEEKLNMAKVG